MNINNSEDYEVEHVHRVYEHIAPHFSATRFKVLGGAFFQFHILDQYEQPDEKWAEFADWHKPAAMANSGAFSP